MKTFPPSIFNAYNICKRQAWLMFHGLTADQDNLSLEIGRLIDHHSFKRERKRIYIADIESTIDMVIKKNGHYYITEIKKSSKTLETGIFQLKYYLYLLKAKKNIQAKGIIKIPKEKISKTIELTHEDEERIEEILNEMGIVLYSDTPPKALKKSKRCKVCAHYEFCFG